MTTHETYAAAYRAESICRLPDCAGCRERESELDMAENDIRGLTEERDWLRSQLATERQLTLRLTGELQDLERENAVLRENLRLAGWEELK